LGGAIGFVDVKLVPVLAAVGDMVILPHDGKCNDVDNAIRVEPNCAVAREIAHKVC
jgi:hypothetical protein